MVSTLIALLEGENELISLALSLLTNWAKTLPAQSAKKTSAALALRKNIITAGTPISRPIINTGGMRPS